MEPCSFLGKGFELYTKFAKQASRKSVTNRFADFCQCKLERPLGEALTWPPIPNRL